MSINNATMQWQKRYGSAGYPFQTPEPAVPRISDAILDSVFFLYPSRDAAERRERQGGSGFFTSIPSTDPDYIHVYAVTNKHLIDDGHRFLRVNTFDGSVSILETDQLAWKSATDDDLSVLPIELDGHHQYRTIPRNQYVSDTIIAEHNIGPGDDVCMVGRFVNRDGVQQNSPSVRSGVISIMHQEKIKHRLGHDQETISVEMRSIGGYSGSPVFVIIPPFSVRHDNGPLSNTSSFTAFLGVDWGHVQTREPVLINAKGDKHPDGLFVEYNSGMANVVPAWRLAALLDIPQLACAREEEDQKLAAQRENLAPRDVLDQEILDLSCQLGSEIQADVELARALDQTAVLRANTLQNHPLPIHNLKIGDSAVEVFTLVVRRNPFDGVGPTRKFLISILR